MLTIFAALSWWKRKLARLLANPQRLGIALVGGFVLSTTRGDTVSPGSSIPPPKSAASFFGLTNVWTIHLEASPAGWNAMDPSRSGSPIRGPTGPARIGASQNNFYYASAVVEIAGQKFEKVGLRFKGHSSFWNTRGSLKRPFKIDFNRFVKGQKFLGLTKLNLNNNAMDASQIREAISYDVFREAGVSSPRTAFAKVYLTVPGLYDRQYLGLYTLVEQVDGNFLEDRFGSKNGLLLKPELPPGLRYFGEDWPAYRKPYEAKNEPTPEEASRFINFIKLITSGDEETFHGQVEQFMDVDQFLRFLAVTVAVSDTDSVLGLGHNFYLFQQAKPKRIVWIPWDLNLSLGSGGSGMELSIRNPAPPHNRVVAWILKDERWFSIYQQHLQSILDSAFDPVRTVRMVGQLRSVLREPIALESLSSLARFERALVGGGTNAVAQAGRLARPVLQPGGRPQLPVGVDVAEPAGISFPLTKWLKGRAQSIAAQLAGRSEGQPSVMGGPGIAAGVRHLGPGGRLVEAVFRDAGLKLDAKLSGESFQQAVRRWFQQWDTDRSGTLSELEIKADIAPAFGPPPELLAQMPAQFALRQRPFGPERFMVPQWFRRIDLDRNGIIWPIEWQKAFDGWFGEWDTNRDGKLDAEELSGGLTQTLLQPSEGLLPGGADRPSLPGNGPVAPRPNPR